MLWLQTSTVAGVVINLLFFFSPTPLKVQSLLIAFGLLLLVTGIGSIFYGNQNYLFSKLKRRYPHLTSALQVGLALEQEVHPSKLEIFFVEQHLKKIQILWNEANPLQSIRLWKSGLAFACMGLLTVAAFTSAFLRISVTDWLPGNSIPDGSISFRILLPAYVQKPPILLDNPLESFSLLKGSRLEIYRQRKAETSDSPSSGKYTTTDTIQDLLWIMQPAHWLTVIAPQDSGTLSLGRGPHASYEIEVVPDTPPKLKITWPQSVPIFANSLVSLPLAVSDDYGLQQIVLHYQIGTQTYQEVIQAFEGMFTTHEEAYPWDLAATEIVKGDRVQVWIEASDSNTLSGPGKTISDKWEFTVGAVEEYHQNLMVRVHQMDEKLRTLLGLLDQQSLEAVIRLEGEVLKDIDGLKKDLEHDSILSPPLKALLTEELQTQILVHQQRRTQLH